MIPTEREPLNEGPPVERCAFCRTVTPYWTKLAGRTAGDQVACCTVCAGKHDPKDVPTKDEWFRKERSYTRNHRGFT